MAKIYSYDAARTYSMELINTEADLHIGDLVTVTDGVATASNANPTYIVVGKVVEGKVPCAAILDDMILESDTEITGFVSLGNKKYRK